MKVVRTPDQIEGTNGVVLTLGNFDGIHLGHQKILKTLKERAEKTGLPSVVYTFEPHPRKVVSPEKGPPLIITQEEKIALIEGFGIDYLLLAHFTKEFAATHPREFVEDVLAKRLRVREVWVGHDYSFGRGREGSVEYLKEMAERLGFRVGVIPAFKKEGVIVSSSLIRRLVKEGDVKRAATFLGRPFSLTGKVVKGEDRGTELGFPTANIEVREELLPKEGVYAGLSTIEGRRYQSVVNVGRAPTFDRKKTIVETHILDFSGIIYGKDIRVTFVDRIRDEKKFPTVEELTEQIKKDITMARRLLG